MRDKLNLDQFESDSEAPDRRQQDKDSARPSSVSVHEFGQYSAVVTVKPISIHSDRLAAAIVPVASLYVHCKHAGTQLYIVVYGMQHLLMST